MLSMGQDVDELELQPDGSPDRGEDQDGQALSQIDRLDRTDCERDPNNDSGVDLDEMRGPNERGSDVLSAFLSKLSSEEQHRYEAFRRAHLTKSTVKRLVQSILGHGIAGNSVIVIQSAGKLFVGEIIKLALGVMEELGEDGPLQPSHIREAIARIQMRSSFLRSPFLDPGTML